MAYDVRWDKYNPWLSIVQANQKVPMMLPKHLYWTGNFAYRFMEQTYASSDPWGDSEDYTFNTYVELQSFAINKVTPCGIRIFVRDKFSGDWTTRFVNLEANKTFALPTIPEAITSYIARKERQASIYENRARTARDMIQSLKPNEWGL